SRWQYITSKVVAISGMVVMGTLAGMLVALIVSALITLIAGNPDYSFVDVGYIGDSFASYGRTLLAMSPYIAMAVFFSTWGRSTMGGIGASLGVLFLETIITSLMQLAGEVPARITNVFPGANADTLMLENGLQIAIQQRQDPTLDVPVLDSPFAALVLATYVVGFLIATYVLFERRDVQP
ncbi:MAG TPA: ABC transporter permease subunit, partial [Dehalococcoidia bacterium]|nr:ABC transporter permease subunit [Dehalococcoidia bacterium]